MNRQAWVTRGSHLPGKAKGLMKGSVLPPAYFATVCYMLIAFFIAGEALAQEEELSWTGHVFYGQMNMQNDDPNVGGGDYDITIFGADAQKPLDQGAFQYGLETGILFSLDSDVRRYSASSGSGGGSVSVSVDINAFMVDYFFGGYVALEPAARFRLYSGAGPLLIWAQRETEPREPNTEPFVDESDSGLGVGLYARAGLDIFLTDRWGAHAGIRATRTTLKLKDASQDLDIQGWQYYFGMALHF